jgi:membrane associated rhomboid family serine protease
MGFLIFRGWFERRFLSVLAALAMAVLWGGEVIANLFPGDPHVSWQAHLFGFLGGVVAAVVVGRRARARARG